jgi:hypothetical protein
VSRIGCCLAALGSNYFVYIYYLVLLAHCALFTEISPSANGRAQLLKYRYFIKNKCYFYFSEPMGTLLQLNESCDNGVPTISQQDVFATGLYQVC